MGCGGRKCQDGLDRRLQPAPERHRLALAEKTGAGEVIRPLDRHLGKVALYGASRGQPVAIRTDLCESHGL